MAEATDNKAGADSKASFGYVPTAGIVMFVQLVIVWRSAAYRIS